MKNIINLIQDLNQIYNSLEFEDNLEKTEKKISLSESKIIQLFKEYFKTNNHILEDVFKHEYYKFNKSMFDDFLFQKRKQTQQEIEQDKIRKLKFKISRINDYLSLIEFQNTYDNEQITSINEKQDFILKKLNLVFNDNYYSISKILDLNYINNRQGEAREIAENLAKRGYLILLDNYGNNDYVKISVKGASYIERKTSLKNKKKSQEELDLKIKKITEMLIKLGYGQEIIFNEMEEIRNLHSKLNEKNWSELVKGKLIDLGLSQVINKEIITKIFETLIDQKFRLLN